MLHCAFQVTWDSKPPRPTDGFFRRLIAKRPYPPPHAACGKYTDRFKRRRIKGFSDRNQREVSKARFFNRQAYKPGASGHWSEWGGGSGQRFHISVRRCAFGSLISSCSTPAHE